MMNLRPVFLVVGILLATLGCAMMIPALYELVLAVEEISRLENDLDALLDLLHSGDGTVYTAYEYINRAHDDWIAFVAAAVLTLFVGVAMAFANKSDVRVLSTRQAFVLRAASWIALTAFSALPLWWSSLGIGYTDAFFEAMSGITTTGATVLTGLDNAPRGVRLWRSLLQWLGGVGIIVMAIAVLPMLQIGGMQLFRMESSDNSEKILPRATQIAGSIILLYVGLTLLCALGYFLAEMTAFEAVAHAMTTIATGGFSIYDASMGHFSDTKHHNAEWIEAVCVVFMIVGSLPFVLYLQAMRGKVFLLLRDSQVHWFFVALAIFIVLAWAAQGTHGLPPGPLELRDATFSVVSIMTGTGYTTVDYTAWSSFTATLFFCIMFVGGCAGSTSCGIKIFRFQVLFEMVRQQVRRFLHPNGVFIPKYNGNPMQESVFSSVMGFLFLFLFSFAAISFLLGLYSDIDTVTALSATASAIANVGPGIGDTVGPAGNFQTLPDGAKWLLSLAMLMGRLELYTILVFLVPDFWRA